MELKYTCWVRNFGASMQVILQVGQQDEDWKCSSVPFNYKICSCISSRHTAVHTVDKRSLLLYRFLMPSIGMGIRLLGLVTFAWSSPCVHSTIKWSPNLCPRHPNIAFRRLNLLCSVLIYSSSRLPLTHFIFLDTILLLRYFTPFK